MPTIVRKSVSTTAGGRREVFHAVSWLVSAGAWNPPTDAYETESAYIVRVEIGGMREEDFEVAFEKNILLVSGVRLDASDRRAYHQMEIRFGKFAAAVAVPVPVYVDSATAQYANGLLTVVLPKSKSNEIKVD
jgi:HSP20 family protein